MTDPTPVPYVFSPERVHGKERFKAVYLPKWAVEKLAGKTPEEIVNAIDSYKSLLESLLSAKLFLSVMRQSNWKINDSVSDGLLKIRSTADWAAQIEKGIEETLKAIQKAQELQTRGE